MILFRCGLAEKKNVVVMVKMFQHRQKSISLVLFRNGSKCNVIQHKKRYGLKNNAIQLLNLRMEKMRENFALQYR